jgi:hypothetical protein
MTAKLSLSVFKTLVQSADYAPAALKEILLGATPGMVAPDSPRELGQLLAFLLMLSRASNGKTEFSEASPEAFEDIIKTLPLHRGSYSKKDDKLVLKLEKGIPALEWCPSKVAAALENPWPLLKAAGFSPKEHSLEGVRASICTHPVRLTDIRGDGGFVYNSEFSASREGNVLRMISEADFLTRESATLTCNAAEHRKMYAVLPWIFFEGAERRVYELVRSPKLRELIRAEFVLNLGVKTEIGLDDFLGVEENEKGKVPFGEARVFAGDVGKDSNGKSTVERLAVFTPFALSKEIARARASLEAQLKQEREAQIPALEAQIEELEKSKPTKKAEKAAHQAEIKKLKADLKRLQRDQAYFWNSPAILVGGENPQNVALDLDTKIHYANVRVTVPFIRRAGVDVAVARTYVENGRLGRAHLSNFENPPRFLDSKNTGRKGRAQRSELFIDLALQVLEPLLSVRDEYQSEIEASSDTRMQKRDRSHLEGAPTAWRTFVRGNPELSTVKAREELKPIITEVLTSVVSEIEHAAKLRLCDEHRKELSKTVETLVLQEAA